MPPTPEEIRAARRRADLTQAELARVLGTTKQTIYTWEKGLHSPNPGPLRRRLRAWLDERRKKR